MKRGIITAIVFVTLILPGIAGAAKNPWEKKLPFKNMTVYYDLTGMETGTEIFYVRKHGKQTARYHNAKTSMLGMTMNTRTIQITDPEWVYSFDLEERTGTKSINPQKLMIEEYNKLSRKEKKEVEKNAKEMGTSMMNGMQGKVEKNAKKILGYSCDLVEVSGSIVYSIHDTPIALYSDANMMGINVKSVATKVDKGSIADKYFQFPEGIEPQPNPDGDRVARSIARQTIAALKDPESVEKKSQPKETKAAAPPQTSSQNKPKGTPPKEDSSGAEEVPSEEQQAVEETMKVLKGLFGN